jgi:hypothetical protein
MFRDDFEMEEESEFKKLDPRVLVGPLVQLLPELVVYDENAQVDQDNPQQQAGNTEEEKIVELTAPDSGTGLIVEAGESWAYIMVPPSRSGLSGEELWKKVWPCVQAIEFHTGYTAYDPQLDRILDLRRDLPEVLKKFLEVAPSSPIISAPTKKPSRFILLLLIPLWVVAWSSISILLRNYPDYLRIVVGIAAIILINIVVKHLFLKRKQKDSVTP